MSRVKRLVATTLMSALVLGMVSGPALAINDALVPAGHCANSSSAVGTPQGGPNPGLDTTDKVGPPASDNNPGHGSTGAKGEENSQAPCAAE
jgi:hypothetical protein